MAVLSKQFHFEAYSGSFVTNVCRMGFSVYVYYRVPVAQEAGFRNAALAMQAALSARIGVRALLKRRPTSKEGLHTWMEVYESVPKDFEAALDAAVEEGRLHEWITSERHREVFQDVAPCV